MDRRTDQQAYFPIEMKFYISVMFLSFPDKIHKEKPSFLDFEKNWLRTDRRADGRTDPLIETRGRIQKCIALGGFHFQAEKGRKYGRNPK